MPYLFPESATDLVFQLGVRSFPEGQRYGARLEETRLDVRVYVDADFPASIAAQLLLEDVSELVQDGLHTGLRSHSTDGGPVEPDVSQPVPAEQPGPATFDYDER